jgi:hypothetical protein
MIQKATGAVACTIVAAQSGHDTCSSKTIRIFPYFLHQVAAVADIGERPCRIYFDRGIFAGEFQSAACSSGFREGEFTMRKISTIGLISAAAALSFFCASAVHSNAGDDPIMIVSSVTAH